MGIAACFSTKQLELIKVQPVKLWCCRKACLSMPSQCHVGCFFKVIVLIESTSTTCSDYVLTCKDLQCVVFSKKTDLFQRIANIIPSIYYRTTPPMIIPPNLPSWLKEMCEKITRLDSRPHLNETLPRKIIETSWCFPELKMNFIHYTG